MRVMIVHKFHYLRAGAETHALTLGKLLEGKGHEVMHFSMHHPQNLKYEHSRFFAEYIEFPEEMRKKGIGPKLKVLKRMFYSKEARDKFSKALDFFRPDIIHLHNIHKHLTISILYEAKKRKIPVVWTLHDYQIICPNYTMLSKGEICEKCRHNYLAPIFERCVKGSLAASMMAAAEKMLNDAQNMDGKVSKYIAPSRFLMNKFVEFGISRKKIEFLHYFFSSSKKTAKARPKERYFLYLGRLSYEKGIATLCEAANEAKIKLKILGEGPLRKELEGKYASSSIQFLGYKQGKELESIRQNAWFTIVPSEWYENNPFAIIESLADGVPVIGANIGGIPELIEEGKTGFLFQPKNINQLTKILIACRDMGRQRRDTLGTHAKEYIRKEYSVDNFYNQLMKIYTNSIRRN